MDTFKWKLWRFAWLAHKTYSWRTTVIDGSGTWKSIFNFRLCVLVDKRGEA